MNSLFIIIVIACIASCVGNETDLLTELKKKYRLLSLTYHPDKHNFDLDVSTILFAELSNIYDLFVDTIKDYMKHSIWEQKYNFIEKKYKKLEKLCQQQTQNYNQLYEDYVGLDQQHIDSYNQLYQDYIKLQQNMNNNKNIENKYNKLVNKYNKLVKDYNNLLED
jgi:curved DNA-binding protein CbpA